MKAYFIFAIALTVAYIIYYAVMIARDLYGKNGEKIKSGEEEFDVSDFDEEESVSAVENDKGFNIGDNEYETHYIDETQNVSEETNPTDEKPKQDVIEALNNKVKANMEETQVTFSNPYLLEVTARGANKGLSVLWVARHLGVRPDQQIIPPALQFFTI